MSAHPSFRERPLYLLGLDGIRFRAPVRPGDQLRIVVDKTGEKRGIWFFDANVSVEGKTVVEGQVMATVLVDRPGAPA